MNRRFRVFLAAPFVQYTDGDGRVTDEWRHRVLRLRQRLLDAGVVVFNAHHNERWGEMGLPPEQCVPSDMRAMAACDVVCAYAGDPVSTGVALELGWASAMRTPVVLASDEGTALSPMLTGLSSVSRVERLTLAGGLDADGAEQMVVATLRLLEVAGTSPWAGEHLDDALNFVGACGPGGARGTDREVAA